MQMSTKREFTHNLLFTFPSAKITLYFQPPNKKETKSSDLDGRCFYYIPPPTGGG